MKKKKMFKLLEKAGFCMWEDEPWKPEGATVCWDCNYDKEIRKYTKLVVEAEREKVANWMFEHSYATGHGDTIEDLLKELEWQIETSKKQAYCDGLENGIEAERKACAVVCENMERNGAWITKAEAAAAIRSRGIDGATVGEVGVWGEK